MSDLTPANWIMVRADAVCDKIQDGTHFSPKVQLAAGKYPYVTAKNVRPSGLDLSDLTYLRPEDHAQIFRRADVRQGDVLLVKDGVNAGDAAINTVSGEISLLSSVCFLRPCGDVLRAGFLRYFLQSPRGNAALTGKLSGTAIRRIILQRVRGLGVPVAPMAEQQRIVEAIESYLTRLDNAVLLLKRVEENLKHYRASVLKAAVEGRLVPTEAELAWREGRGYEPASELLKRILAERKTRWIEDAAEQARAKAEEKARAAGRAWTAADDAAALDRERAKAAKQYKEPAAPDTTELPALPEGWCWVTTEQVGQPGEQSVLTGPFGTTLKSSEFVAVGTPVVTIGCLTEQGINLAKADFITSEKADELARYGLQYGDMLFSRMATVGRAGFVDVSVAAHCPIFNYHIMRLRLHAETIDPRFFLAYVRGSVTVTDYIREINHGMTRDGINTTQLLNMPVVLPPRAEQERIVSEAEHVLSLAQQTSIAAERQRARCARLRQSILKWAFEGKLVEQDPNDEPATVLLERIRTMRATPCPRRHAS